MVESVAKGLIDVNQIRQNILIEKFLQHEESKVSNQKAIYAPIPEIFMIPNFESIEYVGSTDGFEGFKVVTGTANQHISNDRYTAKAKTAWIQSQKVVIYNANPTRLLIRAILNNPRDLSAFNKSFTDNSPFPVCNAFGDMIIGNIVNDYLRHYRLANPQPNTQVEINQQPQQ